MDSSSSPLICPMTCRDVRRVRIQLGADGGGDRRDARHALGELQRRRVGLHRAVERADQPLVAEELAAQRVRRDQRVDRIVDRLQPLQCCRPAALRCREIHAVAGAERRRRRPPPRAAPRPAAACPCTGFCAALARAVDRQRLLQRREDVGVVHDHAAVLAGEHPVRARDGLHQRVVPHRLVEIDRRAARRVEAGQPHRADEDQPQRVVGVLELLVQAGCDSFIRLRCGTMSRPSFFICSISFWPGDTMTAMSVVVSTSSRCWQLAHAVRVGLGPVRRERVQISASTRSRLRLPSASAPCRASRSAVALSMDTTIALP